MGTNKYTFLLPAYKIEFFQEALESILNQTYKDFQLIIQDDCSPYDLKSIVDLYSTDSRIYYYRNEENIGGENIIKCWNKLLSKANSEYIILASDDDVYDVHFLEEIDKLTIKYPNVDLLRARVKAITDKGEIKNIDAIYEEYGDAIYFLYQKHFNNNITCMPCYVFRRKPLVESNGFEDFPLAWHSDDATALKMSIHGIANTLTPLLLFRSSGLNISTRKLTSKDALLKAIATIQYDNFFHTHLDKITSLCTTVLKQKMKMFALQEHDRYGFNMLRVFAGNCCIKDFIQLLSHIRHRKIRFICRYIRARLGI